MTEPNDEANPNLEYGVVQRDSAEAKDRFIWGRAGGKTGGVDRGERTVDGIASTIQVDLDGEIILPSAFKAGLAKWEATSRPFLTQHTHRTATGNPAQIGWVDKTAIEQHRVACKFRFGTTQTAEEWWKLASDPKGYGIMFSIGCIPDRWVYGSVADLVQQFPQIREAIREAGLDDNDKLRVYTAISLLEVSAVGVASNRGAVQILSARLVDVGGGEGNMATETKLRAFFADVVRSVLTEQRGELPEVREGGLPDALRAVVTEEVAKATATIVDKIHELTEEITLVSETSLSATSPAAPPADEGGRRRDAGDGAIRHEKASQEGARVLTEALGGTE